MSFVAKLHEALAHPDPIEVTERTHELVADALRALDPTVAVRSTGLLHAFFRAGPRIDVARPRRQPGSPRLPALQRLVSGVRRGHARARRDGPLFIGMTDLEPFERRAWTPDPALDPAVTLVTQADALEELTRRSSKEQRLRGGLRPVIRLGHGEIDAARARRLANRYIDVLRTIRDETNPSSTAQMAVEAGLALLGTHLPPAGELELERILQIEWLRCGREPSEFPESAPPAGEEVAKPIVEPAPIELLEGEPRVIIVDDDPLARGVIRDSLQRAGLVVIAEGATGREGVELALFYKPDIVVMDIVMPEMDGIEATRAIHMEDPSISVVVLTGASDDGLALRSLRAGAVGSGVGQPRTAAAVASFITSRFESSIPWKPWWRLKRCAVSSIASTTITRPPARLAASTMRSSASRSN
jgi:CheY-like chemotaxis protein